MERGLALRAQILRGKVGPFAARPAEIKVNGEPQRMETDNRHGIRERMMSL